MLVWPIIRKTLGDFWDEAFLLILFNIFWVIGTIPGLFLLGYGAVSSSLPLILLGLIVLLPWPYVTFGLFYVAHQHSLRRAIGLKTFFEGGGRMWRQAYRWAGLNVSVMATLLANVKFYTNPASPLGNTSIGTVLSAIFISLTLLWLLWQLIVLTTYSRLDTPGLWLAFRQAGVLMLTWPAPILSLALLASILGVTAFLVPPLGFLTNFSLIAVLANRATGELLAK